MIWVTSRRTIPIASPLVMGIVNVTPDSFSDGGRGADEAIAHGLQLLADGADILDIGGESTRPGAEPVPADEELSRVVPVVRELARQTSVPISIDTMKPSIARACVDLGAEIINDVSGFRDPDMVKAACTAGAGCIVMHMQGTPQTMQVAPRYDDVVAEVAAYFDQRLHYLAALGIAPDRLAFDPGIGFGKRTAHNWALIAGLGELRRTGRPICLGVSRKGFLGKDRAPTDRMVAGLTVAAWAAQTGSADIIRTHDVRATRDVMTTLQSIGAIP
jgi:dihydropteroate synthase